MSDVTASRWEALRQRRAYEELLVEAIDEGFDDAMIGVDADGRLHFLVAVHTAPMELPPDLQSIEVRVLEGERAWLDCSSRSHHEDLLTMVANKVLFAIRIQRRDPATAVESTIEDLRAAFRTVAPEISAAEQIGLFGELWVLPERAASDRGSPCMPALDRARPRTARFQRRRRAP